MIWGGKRYRGTRVYIGKQRGDFPGEYIVVYWQNGANGSGCLDAVGGIMEGDKYPHVSCTVSIECLSHEYRPLSYKQIPAEDRMKLAKWVID